MNNLLDPPPVNAVGDGSIEKAIHNTEIEVSSEADRDVAALARLGKKPVLKVDPARHVLSSNSIMLTIQATIHVYFNFWLYLHHLDNLGSRADVRYCFDEKKYYQEFR